MSLVTSDDLEPLLQPAAEPSDQTARRRLDPVVVALFLIAIALSVLAANSFQSVRLQRRQDCVQKAALQREIQQSKSTDADRFNSTSPVQAKYLEAYLNCLR